MRLMRHHYPLLTLIGVIVWIAFLTIPFAELNPVQATESTSQEDQHPDRPLTLIVRRDTRFGLLHNDTQSSAHGSLLAGFSRPNVQVSIKLERHGVRLAERGVESNALGEFGVALDHVILAGDTLTVSDGLTTRTLVVPTLRATLDVERQRINGVGPPNVHIDVDADAPHSLAIHIGDNERRLTTDASGAFDSTWTTTPFQPSTMGVLRYITHDGDQVYETIVANRPFARGVVGDDWADVVLGQPDFATITPNTVTAGRLFNPAGVYVDRSITPNRVYVFDGGNNRILGLRALGVVPAGPHAGKPCTSDSDYPQAQCAIIRDRPADIVIGQPSFGTSTCNGDSAHQAYPEVPPASAATLCGMRAEQTSILEGGAGAVMITDAAGHLYVTDYFNNRVLRYDNPFETDQIADAVWGQADFRGHTCNRRDTLSAPTAASLCLAPEPGIGYHVAGVALDATGNLWISDSQNHRVVRFSYDASLGRPGATADLVLGQSTFTTREKGAGRDEFNLPTSVRFDQQGRLLVSDTLNHRVVIYAPPFRSGMEASTVISAGIDTPIGLEVAPDGSMWVNNTGSRHLIRFVDGRQQATIFYSNTGGGIGIDRDGNVLVASWYFAQHRSLRFAAPDFVVAEPFLNTLPTSTEAPNATGPQELDRAYGIEIAGGQLIASDGSRMLVWNRPWRAVSGQSADAVIGAPDFVTLPDIWANFKRMRADARDQLWVIYSSYSTTELRAYKLPLSTGDEPVRTLRSPLPMPDGRLFPWSEFVSIGGIAIQPNCDCLWISDRGYNRVFRIRDASTQPIVDMVLGQTNLAGIQCNQGRDSEDPPTQKPSATSLCAPGGLSFDLEGNLWVADANLEFHGNQRLLRFRAEALAVMPTQPLFGIPADAVVGGGGMEAGGCLDRQSDPLCGPFEPTFFRDGRMVVGLNGYLGSRFPLIYGQWATKPTPIAALGDFYSMPTSARVDPFDNLYIVDHNRTRILIYWQNPIETFAITGQVLSNAGRPVPGVTVHAVGFAATAQTDAQGRYTLGDLPPGTYRVAVANTHAPYTPAQQIITLENDLEASTFQQEMRVALPLLSSTPAQLQR